MIKVRTKPLTHPLFHFFVTQTKREALLTIMKQVSGGYYEAPSKLKAGCYISGIFGYDGRSLYLTHFQKIRKKSVQIQTVVNGKNTTQSQLVRRGHWEVYVYRFDRDNVVTSTQYKNHFYVELSD